MYENIGGKIKKIAPVIVAVGIVSCIGVGFYLLDISVPLGICVALVGSFLSYVSYLILYGFGQLVENTDILVENTDALAEKIILKKHTFRL